MNPVEAVGLKVLARRMKPFLNEEFIDARLKRFDDVTSDDLIWYAFHQSNANDKGIEYSLVQAISDDSEERLAVMCLENPIAFEKEKEAVINKFYQDNKKELEWVYHFAREEGFPIAYKEAYSEEKAFQPQNLFETIRRTTCYLSRESFHRCLFSEYSVDAPFITEDNKSNIKVFGDCLKTLQNEVNKYESKRVQEMVREKIKSHTKENKEQLSNIELYEKAADSVRKLRNKKVSQRNDENNDLLYKLM